jgi:hypothetical protein
MFGASPFCRGLLLATIGVIDLALSIALIAGVSQQSRFLPRSYAGCKEATDWRNGTDGRNFFVAVNQTHSNTFQSPHDICFAMVQNWAVTIAVM